MNCEKPPFRTGKDGFFTVKITIKDWFAKLFTI